LIFNRFLLKNIYSRSAEGEIFSHNATPEIHTFFKEINQEEEEEKGVKETL
jgi:hypothetical protein